MKQEYLAWFHKFKCFRVAYYTKYLVIFLTIDYIFTFYPF